MVKKEEFYAINRKTLVIALFVAAIVVLAIFGYNQGWFETGDDKPVKITPKEEGPPPEFKLVVIENPDCESCMNITQAVEMIKGAPTINVTSDEIMSFTEDEAKKLIKKYKLTRLPAFILFGDALDQEFPPFEKMDDALVFNNTPPVYYDLEAEKEVGKVSVVMLVKSDCKECFNISMISGQLQSMGMAILDEQTYEYDSKEGKALIEEYDIIKVPTIIFSEDAAAYDLIKQAWEEVGSIEDDGKMIMREVNPPYYDVVAKRTNGIVDITYLVDESCGKCYDPKTLKQSFKQGMGMAFDEEKKVDVSSDEGKELLEEYNITLVPTIILSEDAKEYSGVVQAWAQAGVVIDGNYVLTHLELLKGLAYKDLSTGEIKGLPEEPAAEETAEPEADAEETADTEDATAPEETAEEEPAEEE